MSTAHGKRVYVVGNPAVFEEVRQTLAKRSPKLTGTLVIKTPVDKTTLVVTDDVTTDHDLNGDGFNDLLEGVSYRIGYGTKDSPYQWANFTKIYFGSADRKFEQNTSYETASTPDLVNAGLTNKQSSISDLVTSALFMVSIGQQTASFDRSVVAAIHSIMTFGFNFQECLYFIKRNDETQKAKMSEYINDLENNLGKSFAFALDAVKRQISAEPNRNYAQRLKNICRKIEDDDPVLPGFARVGELWDAPSKDIGAQACDGLYERLLDIVKYEEDPKVKAANLRERAFFIEKQKENGGLFDEGKNGFVAQANRYAKERGYENYVALKLDKAHGLNYKEYVHQANNFLEKQSPYFKAMVAELKRTVQPSRPIWELNMSPLFEAKRKEALKKLGLKEEPKLSAEDIIKILKAFYNDLGWNIDTAIANGQLVLDLYPREKKTTSTWHESMGDGKLSIVILNLGDKNNLEELRKHPIHEMAHALHAYYASHNAEGSYWGGTRAGKYGLKETIPTSFENVVYSKDWMDRYLSPVRGFENPKVREVLSKEYGDQLAYWRGIQVLRALWEINLYANENKSMEERLDYWGDLGKKYFGFDDAGIPTSQVSYSNVNDNSTYIHPAFEPMYYVSYCAGADFGKELAAYVVSAVVEKDEDQKRQMLERIKSFFEKSGSMDSVEDAISAWNP